MEDKLNSILGIIDKVGIYLFDKFKLPADKALEIATKQCKVEAYIEIAKVLMWIIPFIIIGIIAKKLWHAISADEDNEGLWCMFMVSCVMGFVFGIGTMVSTTTGIPKIIQILGNPEWYMIERVSALVQSM